MKTLHTVLTRRNEGYFKENDRLLLLKYYAENPNSLMPML